MMDIADRILHLRKARGISQEELAEQVGVSRQAVSKWESAQSTPDIEKIILLSEYFGTTTDYLLKGTEPEKEQKDRQKAMVFAMAGTIINAMGLVAAITIWIERQQYYATGIGIAVMLLGTGIFLAGQITDSAGKARAKYYFLMFNVWILLLIPMTGGYNLLFGLKAGAIGCLAPIPMLVRPAWVFVLFWAAYIGVCAAADLWIRSWYERNGRSIACR